MANIVSNLLERAIDEGKIPNKSDSEFSLRTFDISIEENLDNILLFGKALFESNEFKPDIFIKKTEVLN